MEIRYYNRHTHQLETEKVYGDAAVKWLYQSGSGKMLSKIITSAIVSKGYGWLQSRSFSAKKIPDFIKQFDIKMEDYLPEEGRDTRDPYSSFNQFFIRKFKPGVREFEKTLTKMPAPCEARYFGYENLNESASIPVKGKYMSAKEVISSTKWGPIFENGPMLLARLCPVDYHRFHYPDNGKTIESFRVPGKLHSVNPIALKKIPEILSTNERVVSILETENFGKLAYVEVGATCVGKIVQSHKADKFSRGDEKGYFLFGGSTVIVFGERRMWKPIPEIIENTNKGIEVYSHIGATIAEKI
ncbi:MAG: phosphatidylserine decarboxylase [Bdellovibrio sp.]